MSKMMRAELVMSGPMGGDCIAASCLAQRSYELSMADHCLHQKSRRSASVTRLDVYSWHFATEARCPLLGRSRPAPRPNTRIVGKETEAAPRRFPPIPVAF